MSEILPNSGLFADDSTIDLYRSSMEQMISDLGRKFTLHLKPQEVFCPSCAWDAVNQRSANIYTPNNSGSLLNIPFPRGSTCLVCGGKGILNFPRNIVYTALVRKSPKDLDYQFYGVDPSTVVKLRTVLGTYSDVAEAEFMVLDNLRYIKLQEPYLVGLRDNAFVISLWVRRN